jgi:predicted ATPase
VSGDDGVEPTLRRVMSLPDRTDLDLGAAISAATAGETSLIVLDNCEHVLTGATTVVHDVLAGCPSARVLCTSREPLQIRGERVRRVEPLTTSTGNDTGPAEELYLARAEAATGRPVPDADLALVRELTRSLDGLPLAIELAAARARGLALVDVYHRLDDRFRLLRSAHRDVDDRHRTLESVIAWSHELLTPSDRALMNRLAVFGGTFSLPVAEDVCTADSIDADAVFDGMARLVDKSLVHLETGPGESRYRMLETIRRFGLDRLDASGEREPVEARLVGWVMDLVDRLERDMRTERQDATLRAATVERDVARTALDILLADGRFHDALRIVASVPIDVPRERVRLIDELIPRVGSAHPDTAGRAHLAATNLCVEMGAMESGIAHGQEAGRIYRALDDVGGTAWAAFLESFAMWATGDRPRAREVMAGASSAFEHLGDATGMANAGWIHASLTDDLDTAAQRAADAERLCRALDSRTALAHCLEVRALIGLRRHEVDGLGDRLTEALTAFTDIRHEGCTAHVLEAVAAIAASADAQPDLVAELLGAADHLREISGHTHRPWELEGHAAALDAVGARLSGSDVDDAIERGREHTFDSATAAARRLLAGLP